MTDLLEDLQQEISRRETEGEPAGFWKNHSLVQTPFKILSFRGSSDALVLLYLYERAGAKSFRSDEVELIELVEREETIAQRTGLSLWAVSKSVKSLETAGCIRVERRHNPVTGEKSVSIYILLHSQTAKPLHSAPGLYGVCQRNFEKQYVTMPSETRENIIKFPPAVRQVYLTALALGSSKVSTKFACSKETWLSESLLGRNAFNRGLKICKRAGLLSYKRYIVTLNDPRTGKPSTRTTRERTEHTNTNWKFDLNTVKPTEWLVVVEDVLQRKFIFNGDDFWSVTQRGNWCPFCKTEKTFCINVNVAAYKCFNEKCPQPTGRLGQLVQRVLGSMAQAKARIQRTLKEAEEVEVTI